MKLVRLVLRNQSIVFFVAVAIAAFLMGYFKRGEDGTFNVAFWIGIGVAFTVVPLDYSIKAVKDYKRFSGLAGSYSTYGYKRDVAADKLGPENLTFEQFSQYYGDGTTDKTRESRQAWISTEADKYNLLNDNSTGNATLEYIGAEEFRITVKEKGTQNVWTGVLRFQTANMGSIAWYYSAPQSLSNCAGYKKAVVIEDVKPTRIYLFSDDGQRFGREVLIKDA